MMGIIQGILLLLSVWYLFVIFFLLRGFLSLTSAHNPNDNTFSIIIAARNEEANIGACLASVTDQSLPTDRFEIIVVDDRSTDATAKIVKERQSRFPSLHLIRVDETPSGLSPKKYAVSCGVQRAKNTIVVFTDADCTVPRTWLETIDRYFSPEVGLVQGITSYRFVSGMSKLFFAVQSIDFLSHGIVAAAAIGAGVPLNSNANNFAFRLEAFRQAGGVLEGIGHVVSGDDDLLLQKIWRATKWKIRYMIDRSGAVATMPTLTIAAAFQQRARWGSKTVHYNPLQVVMLSGIFLFYVALILTLAAAPFFPGMLKIGAVLLGIKFIGECMLMIPGLLRFNRRRFSVLLPLASIIQLPVVVAAVLSGIFWKFNWKGQTFSRTIKPAFHDGKRRG